MNDTERNLATNEPGAPKGEGTATVGVDSAARRRALLKGMGSGAALAAAAMPLQALATGGRKKCFHKTDWDKPVEATISGVQSVIASGMAADIPESPGRDCTYYRDTSNWPKDFGNNAYCRGKGGAAFLSDRPYYEVFGCTVDSNTSKPCKDIMAQQVYPHRHWVTACLNATVFGDRFSYQPDEIVAFHNDSTRNLDALNFFVNYQENNRT